MCAVPERTIRVYITIDTETRGISCKLHFTSMGWFALCYIVNDFNKLFTKKFFFQVKNRENSRILGSGEQKERKKSSLVACKVSGI